MHLQLDGGELVALEVGSDRGDVGDKGITRGRGQADWRRKRATAGGGRCQERRGTPQARGRMTRRSSMQGVKRVGGPRVDKC